MRKNISLIFGKPINNISYHIKEVIEFNKMDESEVIQKIIVKQKEGNREVVRNVAFYSLDLILSIGYRLNSLKAIEFRNWANKILKDYLIKGYVYNEKRLNALNKTIIIQNKISTNDLNDEEEKLLDVIETYTSALTMLDNYDHQVLNKPKGHSSIYHLSYEDSREIIDSMVFNERSNVFGVEKEKGKLEGILAAVNQTAFGEEIYKTVEEKAAHLLYFVVKDHPFVDGCKRIAATLFLEFLNRNKRLVVNDKLVISNDALVALTILTAESRADEMEIIISLIMNILDK